MTGDPQGMIRPWGCLGNDRDPTVGIAYKRDLEKGMIDRRDARHKKRRWIWTL